MENQTESAFNTHTHTGLGGGGKAQPDVVVVQPDVVVVQPDVVVVVVQPDVVVVVVVTPAHQGLTACGGSAPTAPAPAIRSPSCTGAAASSRHKTQQAGRFKLKALLYFFSSAGVQILKLGVCFQAGVKPPPHR